MKQQIENDLLMWFYELTLRNPDLKIRYEYSNKSNIFLVSFTSKKKIKDKTYGDLLDFMMEKYDDAAPLVTEDERLFKLSSEANTYVNGQQVENIIEIYFFTASFEETNAEFSTQDKINKTKVSTSYEQSAAAA